MRVIPVSAAQEPLGADANPLGGTAAALVESLGRDNLGNPIVVPGLKIDANGSFVGDDGVTAVEIDRGTQRPKKFNGTLYDLHYLWYPSMEQIAPAESGVPVDSRGRIIDNLLMDSDGAFTSFDGATAYPINASTGFPERPTAAGVEPITRLHFGLSELAKSVNLALVNGATKVWVFRTDRTGASPNEGDGFTDFANKQINIVCLSQRSDAAGITALKDHVEQASPNDAGGGGTRPRIGVAMLPVDGWQDAATNPSQDLGDFGINWASNRMVLVAHKSPDDVAAAVAGRIARYDPWISICMKEVIGISQGDNFTDTEMAIWLDPEANGIIQPRVNPIVDPEFLAGTGLVMGEGYTADGTGQRLYIDIVRTLDDLAFRIKAHLTNPNVIGTMRINRLGLTALRTVISALMNTRVAVGEIDSYTVDIPLLGILKKDLAQRTPEEIEQINMVQNSRRLDLSPSVDYSGAIHYLIVNLKLT